MGEDVTEEADFAGLRARTLWRGSLPTNSSNPKGGYDKGMFRGSANRETSVVSCKGCRCDVPNGLKGFPCQFISAQCPLCGELRQYTVSRSLGNGRWTCA